MKANNASRQQFALLVIIAACAAGVLLRVYGLSHAGFLGPDEYRTLKFSKFNTPLVDLVYGAVTSLAGQSKEVVLTATALMALAAILLAAYAAWRYFSAQSAALCAVFLSLSGTHIIFSRSGYPCMLQSLCILASVLSALRFLEVHSKITLRMSGIFMAFALLSYVPSYAPLLALGFALFLSELKMGSSRRSALICAATYFIYTALTAMTAVAFMLYWQTGSLDFAALTYELGRFGAITSIFIRGPKSTLIEPFLGFWRYGSLADIIIFIGGIACAIVVLMRGRSREVFFLAAFSLGSLALFLALGVAGYHTVYLRHFVWSLPVLSLLMAASAHIFLAQRPFLALLLAVPAAALSLARPITLIEHELDVSEINKWLLQKRIHPSELATWVDLAKGLEREGPTLPGIPVSYPFGYYALDWVKLRRMNEAGVKFILTSGIGFLSTAGFNDPLLAQHKALAIWPHPYRYFHNPMVGMDQDFSFSDFAVYDLREIFKENQNLGSEKRRP